MSEPVKLDPGGQTYFHLPDVPLSISVLNPNAREAGACIVWWVYPTLNPPVSARASIPAGGSQPFFAPGFDRNGHVATAALVFNKGSTELLTHLHFVAPRSPEPERAG